jgi:hypothetical protein
MNYMPDLDEAETLQRGIVPLKFIAEDGSDDVTVRTPAQGATTPRPTGAPTSNRDQVCDRLPDLSTSARLRACTGDKLEGRQVPITNYCARPTPRGLMLLRLVGERSRSLGTDS